MRSNGSRVGLEVKVEVDGESVTVDCDDCNPHNGRVNTTT